MRAFADAWPEEAFVQQAAAQIPWFHNVVILEKIKDIEVRGFYIDKTIENNWSRNILILQIEQELHLRQGMAITNFEKTLPFPQSDLAQALLKDPYCFDFLSIAEDAKERDLEKALVDHIRDFLVELGVGFAFMGTQVHLDIGDQDFYIDMLFYHVKLRSHVVIELKMGDFKPEYAGKLNFYLSAVDDLMRHEDDAPSIGILLCKTKNDLVVEYAIRDMNKPMGVAGWEKKLVESLPEKLKGKLPSIEDFEAEFAHQKEGHNVE